MKVYHTKQIEQYALLNHFDLSRFTERCIKWKENGEFSSYFFGKDGFYSPIHSGLRHVHLVPILNVVDKLNWDKHWKTGQRRTSDTCLVYVEDECDYLLIAILPEPIAHEVAREETEEDRLLMASFRHIAEQFFHYRNIVS